ncbi:Resolvase domain [Xanthobacter versatilis]|uniref:Resolvase domain n=1 Tax=Xanthobacter autotrophicus (strain ATCC BAA-1158 / Py2) TaxID=78245 RepID=A7ICP9_XANP2|nr:Resolvase domain [Xanthobacter autotrophicus Py2]
MLIGYARVSTGDQNLDLQRQALIAAGCQRLHEDSGVSGAMVIRPGLRRALKTARAGDVLVVWRLDRLGRSIKDLIDIVGQLQQRGIGFLSLQEQIDTTSAAGRFYLHMLAALAEFERELIRDRTRAGLDAARSRGVVMGRPRKLSPAQIADARNLIASGRTVTSVAAACGVTRTTLRRLLGEPACAIFASAKSDRAARRDEAR